MKSSAFVKTTTLFALLAISLAAVSSAEEIQNFDSAADAAAHSWIGVNNNPIAGTGGAGGTIAWSNTNNTQGNPAGEAGGAISRTDGALAYYADVNLGRTYSVVDDLTVSGELFVQAGTPAGDTQVLIGYFNPNLAANVVTTPDQFIGFQVSQGSLTVRANVYGGDYGGYTGGGGNLGAPIQQNIAAGAYTWMFTYDGVDADTGEIILTLDPVAAGANIVLRNALAPGQGRGGRPLGAFGMAAYNSGDENNSNTNTTFIDGLIYTSIPEPSSLMLTLFGLASLGLFRRFSRGSKT